MTPLVENQTSRGMRAKKVSLPFTARSAGATTGKAKKRSDGLCSPCRGMSEVVLTAGSTATSARVEAQISYKNFGVTTCQSNRARRPYRWRRRWLPC